MQKLDGKTMDVVQHKIEQLKDIFPEAITDGKVDFEQLRRSLGDDVETEKERYEFTWHGKAAAIRLAQKQTTGTLRPFKEESVNWDTTENLYIEGDNLEVLRILQSSYRKKVKMIYIDPPYNTGRDFVYRDDFRNNVKSYKERLGEVYKSNAETSGRYHTDWLNMMYPRLKIARTLLRRDGFIAVSISDEEHHNLRKIMDEIFGENNFRNDLLVRRYDKNINNQFIHQGLKTLNVGSEHILIYAASEEALFNPVFRKTSEERSNQGYWKGFWNDADRPTMRYDILGYTPESGQWKWRQELAEEAVQNYKEFEEKFADQYTLEEYWLKTGKKKRFIRRREHLTGRNMGVEHWVAPSEGILRSSNWNDLLISESIAKLGLPFDSPKNTAVLKELIRMLADDDSLILDFFAGSSSTAHAVMEMNDEDGGNRRFIMVQIPEQVEKGTKAFEAGFTNICEIGKERIRRAAGQYANGDRGFKVFKLDETNFKVWDEETDQLEQDLLDFIEPLKEGRSEADVVYEIMLAYGFELNARVNETTVAGRMVYLVEEGKLAICLEHNVTADEIKEIAGLKPARIVFYDDSFQDDSARANAEYILTARGVEDVRVI